MGPENKAILQVYTLKHGSPSSLSSPRSSDTTLQACIVLDRNWLRGFAREQNLGSLSALSGLFSLVGKIS